MTQLNDKERAAQMADMKSFDEEMPSIGIFWYAPEDHALFGVGKKELTPKMVEEAAKKGVRHIEYPEKEYFKAAIKREESYDSMNSSEREQARGQLKAQAKHVPTKFTGDYTQVPRGRVAWNIDKFIVLVGHWAEPVLDELTQLIEDTFHLPYFEFVYDEHSCVPSVASEQSSSGDLGHGWSGDMPK